MTSELSEKVQLFLKAKQAYYFDQPIMSDAQFDALEDEIRSLAPDTPELKIVGAPLPANSDKARVRHRMHMGSQEKVNTSQELERWESLRAADEKEKFHVSLKADGSSVALYYHEGRLASVVTRGDGIEGEDITFQAPFFQGVPTVLPEPVTIGIRGEALVTLADWAKIDPSQESNPRNIASGILGRLDVTKSHLVTVLVFDVENIDPASPHPDLASSKSETEKTRLLEKLGFQPVPWKGELSLADAKAFYASIGQERNAGALPYWIDGVVVRYDNLATQKKLGVTDNRPKGQVAWKFPAESTTTVLRDVQWQVGATGAITPVGILSPVTLGGTTVTKASLANPDNVKSLGAFIGATVTVAKAGDIIPQVIGVSDKYDPQRGHRPIETPSCCPACDEPVSRRKNVDGSDSTVIFCASSDCTAQTAGKIRRFCKSRDILGLGGSVTAALQREGLAETPADLLTLNPEKMESLVINTEKGIRLGRKRAEMICQEIAEKTSSMTLPELLGSFGTRALGVRRATQMMEANAELRDLEKWFDGSLLEPSFAATAGVPQLASIIHADLKRNESVIRRVLASTTLVEAPPSGTPSPTAQDPSSPSLKICITGSLPSGRKKKEYEAPLRARGHELTDTLSKDVAVLVVADPTRPSSKTKKAASWGIRLENEEWLSRTAGIDPAPEPAQTQSLGQKLSRPARQSGEINLSLNAKTP